MESLTGGADSEGAVLDIALLEEGWQPCTSILLLMSSAIFFPLCDLVSTSLIFSSEPLDNLLLICECCSPDKRCPQAICGAAAISIVSACLQQSMLLSYRCSSVKVFACQKFERNIPHWIHIRHVKRHNDICMNTISCFFDSKKSARIRFAQRDCSGSADGDLIDFLYSLYFPAGEKCDNIFHYR